MRQIYRWCLCVLVMFNTMGSITSAQEHWMPDPNLRQTVRKQLNLPDEILLTPQEMKRLTWLDARENQIKNLGGLEHATMMRSLNLGRNEISDILPLVGLVHLEHLYLFVNPVSDLLPLMDLTQLRTLHLGACQISDITALAQLTQLVKLMLPYNEIENISSLANLTQLTELSLNNNKIIDVSPLANLKKLTDLQIAGNAITDFSPLLGLNLKNVDIDIRTLHELTSIKVEIPDLNLERAVRRTLELPDEVPLTQLIMNQLTGLAARDSQITDLTGLEHATNLTWIGLGGNEIRDLHPLAGLIQLEFLSIWGTPLEDIRPIANLTRLQRLHLPYNKISDITPLANLIQIVELRLNHNQISDISPLANLTLLETLHIQSNRILDVSPLQHLTLSEFLFDEVCELGKVPVQERIKNRNFPSVFQKWADILNRPSLSYESRVAFHDLSLRGLFGLEWRQTEQGVVLMGDLREVQQQRNELLALNPDLIFITSVHVRDAYVDAVYSENYPYWVRDTTDTPVAGWPGTFLLDFTHPVVQDVIVQQARALSRCGVFDGIFLDWWREDGTVLDGYRTNEAEQQARDVIIRRIREAVAEDFLILVNPNRTKPKRAAPYINGLLMETGRDYAGGYTHQGLRQIESTLLWAEENLRSPQINCLEGWSISTEKPDPSVNYRWTRLVDTKPDTPTNRRWVRVFTAISLTHSDGYVEFYAGYWWHGNISERSYPYNFWDAALGRPIGEAQQHYWYDFWDADLGQPVGEKAQLYENREGLFIREFTNGWAVYNRSGKLQEIRLPEQATGVESGLRNTIHVIPDLDGEIYLKSTTDRHDVNGDGTVNILDLVAVANGFGKDTPDVNGDGIVNILDLVAVANAF